MKERLIIKTDLRKFENDIEKVADTKKVFDDLFGVDCIIVSENDEVTLQTSRDNEIKMQMAKDLLIAQIIEPRGQEGIKINEKRLEDVSMVAEWIFNRFNK